MAHIRQSRPDFGLARGCVCLCVSHTCGFSPEHVCNHGAKHHAGGFMAQSAWPREVCDPRVGITRAEVRRGGCRVTSLSPAVHEALVHTSTSQGV